MLRIFLKRNLINSALNNGRLLSGITKICNAEHRGGSGESLELVNPSKPAANNEPSYQLPKAFDSLFEIYKRDRGQVQNILSSKEFSNYCVLLKRNASQLAPNDILSIVKVLNRLNIKSNSKMMQQLLHLLKENINDLTIANLAFLNLLLKQMEPTPLIEALLIAIPIVFDVQISDQIDHENAEEVHKIFHHFSITDMKISKKSVLNLITALAIHGNTLPINIATSCMVSLCRMPTEILHEQPATKLIQNCLEILNSPQFVFTDFRHVGTVLFKMVMRCKDPRSMLDIFYNEKFFNKVANFVIRDDLGFQRAFQLISALNDISFVNYPLLDYIDKKIIQNESLLKNMELGKLRVLITALSNASYKTESCEILKSILHENTVFSEKLPIYIPMLKTTVELMSLNFVSKILLEKVLHPDYLNEHCQFFSKNKNFTPFSNLRLLCQSIQLLYPEYIDTLPPKVFLDTANDRISDMYDEHSLELLEFIYGNDTVLTNIRTNYGHRLDFVINFDRKTGEAFKVSKDVKFYEQIPTNLLQPIVISFTRKHYCPSNLPAKLKSIHELRRQTLAKIGINEIFINSSTLENLPDAEKCPYIEREVSIGSMKFEN